MTVWVNWKNKEISYQKKEGFYEYGLSDDITHFYINWDKHVARDNLNIDKNDFMCWFLEEFLTKYCTKEEIIEFYLEDYDSYDICRERDDLRAIVDADYELFIKSFEKIKIPLEEPTFQQAPLIQKSDEFVALVR